MVQWYSGIVVEGCSGVITDGTGSVGKRRSPVSTFALCPSWSSISCGLVRLVKESKLPKATTSVDLTHMLMLLSEDGK